MNAKSDRTLGLYGKEKLKTLDLFAGIGGFSLGLEKTGLYETTAFCEYDGEARKVLRKHWSDIQIFEDVRNLKGYSGYVYETYYKSGHPDGLYDLTIARPVDIITGGFPCQDISYSGKGAGLNGARSGLWFDYLRLISEIKPKGVIIENVSALRTRGLGTVLQGLNSVGYDAEWHCIPSSHLGAAHRRDRLFIVAYARSIGRKNDIQMVKTFSQRKETVLRSEGNLQAICDNPFGRSFCLPPPLIRRGDDGFSRRVDRLKQIGNSIYWPIASLLGKHLYENLERMKNVGP